MGVQLTANIVSKVDVKRVHRELEALDEYMLQTNIRTPGTPMALPRLSRTLDDLSRLNQLNLLDDASRKQLRKFLELVLDRAPELHMSFASEPSGAFTQRMIMWLRSNIQPQLLLSVGLQPIIAIGSVVRTPNKVFDFSLHEHLEQAKSSLSPLIIDAQNGTEQHSGETAKDETENSPAEVNEAAAAQPSEPHADAALQPAQSSSQESPQQVTPVEQPQGAPEQPPKEGQT